jgi:hypothetical protein
MQDSEGCQPPGAGRIVDETERRSTQTRERAWRRAQAVSGLIFLVFALLNLVNTMLAAWSAETYDGFQHGLRPFYQYPALEIGLVMGPLLVHVAAALRRLRLGGQLYAIPDPSDNAYAQMWRELGVYEWIAPPPGS